jgi:DNA-binding GntR family transcriptional regulator
VPRVTFAGRRPQAGLEKGLSEVTLAEKAYHLILDQILRGTLSVGVTVSRVKLAEQFGMSLVPVGEALQRLELEGLVESRRRAGTRVRVPTAEDVREVHDIREALECQAARMCAERLTFEEVLELKRLAEDLDALFATAASKESDEDFLFAVGKYHIAFHMRIAECARSESLRSAIEKSHVLTFRWIYDRASGNQISPGSSHQELVAHIVEGPPQEAEDAMRAHVRYSLGTVEHGIAQLQAGSWRLKRPRRVKAEVKEGCASRDGPSIPN